ncbi:MAG: 6-phosphogluconolactonase [Elainellaceae cyanobacterium]
MTRRTVEVLPDKAALIQRSLELVCGQIKSTITARGRCTIALSGGSTPKPLYEAIAAQELPWDQVYVFWGDERYVPPDHPDSNEGMARTAWLDRVPIPADHIYPMPTHYTDPAAAAAAYAAQLQSFFNLPPDAMPALDIVLLGMGDDGHTASLFPHTDALQVSDRPVTVGNKNGEPRLTLTLPCINQAHCVLFVVAGANKQNALAQIFAESADDQMYPSRLIQPQGQLWWLLDQAAGSGVVN